MNRITAALALALAGVLSGPATAALTATIDLKGASTLEYANTSPIDILLGIRIDGLDTVVNLQDAPGLDVELYFGPASPSAPYVIDGVQLGGAFPDGPVTSVSGSSYCRPDTDTCINFGPGLDPIPGADPFASHVVVSFATLELPASGEILTFHVRAPAGVDPGTWRLNARVTADPGLPSGETFSAAADADLIVSAPVPEPETWALMATGLALVGGLAWRRRA